MSYIACTTVRADAGPKPLPTQTTPSRPRPGVRPTPQTLSPASPRQQQCYKQTLAASLPRYTF